MGTAIRQFLSRLLAVVRRNRSDDGLDEEISGHLDLLTADHIRHGLSLADARAAARREFGGVDQIREQYRDQRGFPWLETFVRDLRVGWRSMRRTPALTAVIVLTLGVVAGATELANAGSWNQNHPRRTEVNARLNNQNWRINQERREGEISRGEARALHAQDRFIRTEERFMAAQHGGHITRAEQRALNQQENAVSREIGR